MDHISEEVVKLARSLITTDPKISASELCRKMVSEAQERGVSNAVIMPFEATFIMKNTIVPDQDSKARKDANKRFEIPDEIRALETSSNRSRDGSQVSTKAST